MPTVRELRRRSAACCPAELPAESWKRAADPGRRRPRPQAGSAGARRCGPDAMGAAVTLATARSASRSLDTILYPDYDTVSSRGHGSCHRRFGRRHPVGEGDAACWRNRWGGGCWRGWRITTLSLVIRDDR